MFPKGQMANLMRQAQQMNEKMQEEIADIEATGEAAAGLVRITLNGAKEMKNVSIADEAMEDREMLEDLVIAAYNNAHTNLQEQIQQKTQAMTRGLGLPPGMKLPF